MRLLTNNPKKTDAFIYGGFDLEVVDQVPIVPPINEHNAALPGHQARQDGAPAAAGLRELKELNRREQSKPSTLFHPTLCCLCYLLFNQRLHFCVLALLYQFHVNLFARDESRGFAVTWEDAAAMLERASPG